FRIQGNGTNYGNFNYADLPVFLGPFQEGAALEFIVTDNQIADCSAFTELAPVFCGAGDCELFDLVLQPSDCNPASNDYSLTIDFAYQNPTHTHFDLIYNNQILGYFALADLPVTIEHFEDNGEDTPFIQVCINDNPNCCTSGEFIAPNCSGGDCEIWDLHLAGIDCSGGEFYAVIDFNYNNVGNDGFSVHGNGHDYGTFSYADVPITLGPLPADATFYEFVVADVNHPDCSDFIDYGVVDCNGGACHFSDFLAEAHDCDGDGNYLLDFEFNAEGVGSEGFTVFANGNELGSFAYGETFYTVGPLHGGALYEIFIQDNQVADCGFWNSFGPVFCDDQCHINDLHAEVSDCDDQGQFYVTIGFEYAGVGNDGFRLAGNGNVYGFFGYDELPVTVGPFPSQVDFEYEFVVSDVQHPDCGQGIGIDTPDCGNGHADCAISDLVADATDCADNGTFYVVLDFDFENTSNIGFRVDGNGINYGLFSYDAVPVSIGPLVGTGAPLEFVVRDLNQFDCAAEVVLEPIECEPSGDCAITDLVADPGACHTDGTYNLWLNFSYENVDNNHFDVYQGGNLIGFYPLANLPIVIPHFHGNGDPSQEITICINDNPDCCTSVSFDDPQCMSPALVWPGDADLSNSANNFDLLNLGFAFGSEGEARATLGFEWTGLPANDWGRSFANGVNFKHSDCNGDGIVNQDDVQAIAANYNETHDEVSAPVLLGGTEDDPPFYVDLPDAGSLSAGSPFTAPIILGSEDQVVSDLYGIAFSLHFDPEIIAPASIELQYDPSWLGVVDVNLITLDKTFADEGRVDVALVRTDHNNVSGHGQVLAFIGIIDNIAGKDEMKMDISDVRAISGKEVLIPVRSMATTVNLTTGTKEYKQGVFKVYPNPVGDKLFLQHPNGIAAERVEIQNMTGETVLERKVSGNQLGLEALGSGVYFLRIYTAEGAFVEKLIKL
ncbi:MAG TPA: T9SS type A sorting domain-containing protein, partial [Bacteroidetes bacterium]|nr:T9SS type A sorting domain-containing protein [Bacteroidota bacterium]